jgi:hypothetical protein
MLMSRARDVAEMGDDAVPDLMPQVLVDRSGIHPLGDKDGIGKRIDLVGRMLSESRFLRGRETEAQLNAQLPQQPIQSGYSM